MGIVDADTASSSNGLGDVLLDGDDQLEHTKVRKKGYVVPERRTTWYNAAAVLVAELVGTGVLGLPSTFAAVGWIPGVLLLVVFALLAFYSGYVIHVMSQVGGFCCGLSRLLLHILDETDMSAQYLHLHDEHTEVVALALATDTQSRRGSGQNAIDT